MRAKTQSLILLGILALVDILPVPIMALLLLYVILRRPPGFRSLVDRLYEENS